MTIMDKNQKTSIEGLKEKKRQYDIRMSALKSQFDKLREDMQRDLATSVLKALNEGVPQTRIGMDALGYNQANGIRSLFGLPMRGDITDHLRLFIAGVTGAEAASELAGALDATQYDFGTKDSVLYDSGERRDTAEYWNLERPDGTIYRFYDVQEFGYMLWSERPKGATLTEAEIELLEAEKPQSDDRLWKFDPRVDDRFNG